MEPRASESPRAGGVRRQRALATRRRIIKAAYHLFCERGYAATTMNEIAAASGVAVQTLYFTFGTKGAILGEALGAAVVGFDLWSGPPADPPDADTLTGLLDWYGEFEAAPDSRQALQIFVDNGAALLRRVGPLHAAMIAASADADAATVVAVAEQRRVETFGRVVAELARRGALQTDEAQATDVLLVLFSPLIYHELTAGRGWSHQDCQDFLLDILAQQLLDARPAEPQDC